jgi:hypothetical protein
MTHGETFCSAWVRQPFIGLRRMALRLTIGGMSRLSRIAGETKSETYWVGIAGLPG